LLIIPFIRRSYTGVPVCVFPDEHSAASLAYQNFTNFAY
jgi:hypothetical protein